MPEKEPQFTVNDRRKFTLDGELRDDGAPRDESATVPAASPTSAAQQPNTPAPEMPQSPASQQGEPEAIPQPTAEESAQQMKDYRASSLQLDEMLQQANAGAPVDLPMSFDRLVQSVYMTAAMQMGAGTEPNEQPRIDILGARQSIDMLSVLEEKTKGNLSEEEKRLLQNALFDLRMSFLEITNAIANSAKRPLAPGSVRK